MGSLVTIGSEVPVGYQTPPFPSLSLPIDSEKFRLEYLYKTYDIWKFTLYWTLIFSVSFHTCAAVWSLLMNRKLMVGIGVIGVYVVISAIEACISGSLVGLILAAIYRSGSFGMTTWMPFVWGLAQVFFMVITSYSMMSILL